MKPRSILLIVLIVVIPIALLSMAALRLARSERMLVQQRFREVMQQRLQDISSGIDRHFDDVSRQLRQLTSIDQYDVQSLRRLNRQEPRVLQLFVLTQDGNLIYPDPSQPLTDEEQGFLMRAARMITERDLSAAVALGSQSESDDQPEFGSQEGSGEQTESNGPPVSVAQSVPQESFRQESFRQESFSQNSFRQAESSASDGWFVWYWDRGLHLIYWQRRPSGVIVGAALDRARSISDLIAELPDTGTPERHETYNTAIATRIRLTGADSEIVYQWGGLSELDEHTAPLCEIPLAAPLSSWRLQCIVSPHAMTSGISGSTWLSLTGSVIAVSAALTLLAVLLFRDYSRDMREAAQQVSFVNQVSHELRTPLTNIRMYSELLEKDLDGLPEDIAETSRRRLEVIHGEGQRLSRLIGNVLTFARQQKKTFEPRPEVIIPDDVISRTLERFRPGLESLGIVAEHHRGATDPVSLDADVLEQILGNLINNVEKYAADGRLLRIKSSCSAGQLMIVVEDAGPGIAASRRNDVFRPFFRLSSDIRHPAGTGIGLTIVRDLARSHGGDAKLCDSDRGCRFEVVLAVNSSIDKNETGSAS